MTDYKSIHFTVDFAIDDKVLTVVSDFLSKQPEPHPYIEPNSAGYNFHFHTLDIKLLKKNVKALTEQDLFSGNGASESQKAGEILQIIFDEVSKIGSYGIKSGKRQYVDFNVERKVKNRKGKEKNRSQYYYAQENDFQKQIMYFPQSLQIKLFAEIVYLF